MIIELVSAFQKHITCIGYHQLEFDLYFLFDDLSQHLMTLDFRIFNLKITSIVSAFQNYIIWWGSKYFISKAIFDQVKAPWAKCAKKS